MQDRSGQPPPFTGWRLARAHVSTGRNPSDSDLADLSRIAAQANRKAPIEQHLHHLHLACHVVASVLLAPWVSDGATLDVGPTELGVRLRDGAPTSAWVSEIRLQRRTPDAFGRDCADVLSPVIAAVAQRSGRPHRTISRLAQDRLAGELARLRRHVHEHVSDDQIAAFLTGLGGRPRPARHVTTEPDDGPPVQLRIPNVCCVLHTNAHPDACPTCPRRRNDNERTSATTDWLRSLDDADFQDLTGRERLVRGHPGQRARARPTTPPTVEP